MKKRTFISRLAVLCAAAFILSGCGSLFDPGPPMSQVILPVHIDTAATADRMPVRVLVSYPVTDAAASTDRIMALMNGFELRALDSARWVAPVPGLVQRLLIDSLEASRRLQAVGWEESAVGAEIRLTTDIRRFYLRYDAPGENPVADIGLVFSLMDISNGKIISRRIINVERQCAGNSLPEFVAAFSAGMAEVLEQANEWVLGAVESWLEKPPARASRR